MDSKKPAHAPAIDSGSIARGPTNRPSHTTVIHMQGLSSVPCGIHSCRFRVREFHLHPVGEDGICMPVFNSENKIKEENNLQINIHDGKQIIGGRGGGTLCSRESGGLGSFVFFFIPSSWVPTLTLILGSGWSLSPTALCAIAEILGFLNKA